MHQPRGTEREGVGSHFPGYSQCTDSILNPISDIIIKWSFD